LGSVPKRENGSIAQKFIEKVRESRIKPRFFETLGKTIQVAWVEKSLGFLFVFTGYLIFAL